MLIDHAKITRRARRAWRDGSRRYHRISDITAISLKYRPPTKNDYRGSTKILVTLETDGEITIHGVVGPDTLDLLTKADLDKLNKSLEKEQEAANMGISVEVLETLERGDDPQREKQTYRRGR